MATIRKRGHLQWEARIRRKGYPVTCKTFETKTDAEAWARAIESEMDKGTFISRSEAESTTLYEALARYLQEYVPKFAHPHLETARIKALQRRAVATRVLASIRGKDIADFIKEREAEGMSGNTIRLDINTISRVFQVASSSWGMESLANPVSRVQKPKVNPGRQRRLEAGEEGRLLEKCVFPLDKIVLFALETAMRREEIATLDWSRVDLQKRAALLPKTKNGDARSVPLSPAALKILETMPGEHAGLVFGALTGPMITRRMIRACKNAGIADLTFHDLRHEAISRLFERTDLDVMEIRTISGHRNLQMLARYSHLRTHMLADRLAGAKRGETKSASGTADA